MSDKFNLQRFVDAQNTIFHNVINELKNGKKQTHWMWFVFPQLKGLGRSSMSDVYGISGIEEARAYLTHPVLGKRYTDCLQLLLENTCRNPVTVFGFTDSCKLQSSLTLFTIADSENVIIHQALDTFFTGIMDFTTQKMLSII